MDFLAEMGGVGGLAEWALLAVVAVYLIRSLVTGGLVVRRSHEDVLNDRDRAIQERDVWRELALDRIAEQGKRLDAILEVNKTLQAAAESIQEGGDRK